MWMYSHARRRNQWLSNSCGSNKPNKEMRKVELAISTASSLNE